MNEETIKGCTSLIGFAIYTIYICVAIGLLIWTINLGNGISNTLVRIANGIENLKTVALPEDGK